MKVSMSCAGLVLCVTSVFAQTDANSPSTRSAVPQKSIKDLVAQVESTKPKTERIEAMKALLAQPFPEQGSKAEQITLLRRQAQAAEELGRSSLDLQIKRRNAELASGTPAAPVTLAELASAEARLGNLARAWQMWDRVHLLNPGWRATAFAILAKFRITAGDVKGAEEALQIADEGFRNNMRSPAFAAWNRHITGSNIEWARGNFFAARGKFAEAEAAYRRSIDSLIQDAALSERRFATLGFESALPGVSDIARDLTELDLAALLFQQRRFFDAEALMRAQVERNLARVGRDSSQVAGALAALGGMYLRQGRVADAGALLAEAVRTFERVGAENGSLFVGRARSELGSALFVQGNYAEAIAQVEKWQGDAPLNPGLQPAYLISLALSGQATRALPLADVYLRQSDTRSSAAHLSVGQGKGVKAIILQASGAKAEALPLYREAVRIIADSRARSAGDEGGYLDNRIFSHILEGYMGLLADMQGPEFAALFKESPAREAFAVSDLVRAGSVQKAMAASAARASADKALAEVVRREQDLGHEAAILQRTLGQLLAAPTEQQLTKVMADMRARLGTIEKEQATLTADIEKRFPAYVNLIAPKAPTLDEAVQVLRPGEVLLTVWVGQSRTFVWAVPKSGALAFHVAPVGAKQIDQLAGKVRRTVDPFSHGLADVPPFALDDAHQLYKLVVEPVAAALTGAQHVIVSANGALGAVPFALLPTATTAVQPGALPAYVEYRKVPWLLRRHAITQVPSVNALVTLRALPARADTTQSFAGIGDPVFSKAQMSKQASAGATVAVRGGARVDLRSAGRLDQFDSAELGRLAALPDTGDEVRGIAALFGAKADTLLQVSANEKEVKARDWRSKRVILFATHGLVPGDLNGLDQPALALTAPDVAGVDGDGLLTVEEILNLKLDADWVVLSACNTASGSAEGAEALSGLGRAFFYAGTRALLASNWPVETTSAKLITTGIFKRQAAQATLSKAEALRATMLDLMDTGEAKDAAGKAAYSYAHPLFWAPFSLVGDGS